MTFMDEKIALLEKVNRQLKREEAQRLEQEKIQAMQATDEDPITLETIQAAIKADELLLEGHTLRFEKKNYFDDNLPLILIKDFFEEVDEQEQAVVLVNNPLGICAMYTYLNEKLPEVSLETKKQELEQNFVHMNMYAEVTKINKVQHIEYLCYRTPTGKGWTYNIIFWMTAGERSIVGNLNCLEKVKNTYGLLLEALVLELNEAM